MADNELIAEFMGAKQDQVHAPIGEYMWYDKTHFGIYLYHKNKLLYNTSWDWLMPVVIKCHEIGDAKEREYPEEKDLDDPTGWRSWSYRRVGLSTNIKQVHENVVGFIKWYNSNHPQP